MTPYTHPRHTSWCLNNRNKVIGKTGKGMNQVGYDACAWPCQLTVDVTPGVTVVKTVRNMGHVQATLTVRDGLLY